MSERTSRAPGCYAHPVPQSMCAACGDAVASYLRDTLAGRLEAATARAEEAERWRVDVAEGLGYINRPEGQSGYEVAEPSVIIDAFRAAQRQRDDFEDVLRVSQQVVAKLRDERNARAEASEAETDRLLRRVAALEGRLARVLRLAQGTGLAMRWIEHNGGGTMWHWLLRERTAGRGRAWSRRRSEGGAR
jgi:hypothetical protein